MKMRFANALHRAKDSLVGMLRGLWPKDPQAAAPAPEPEGEREPAPEPEPAPQPTEPAFFHRSFAGPTGERRYKLYIPGRSPSGPRPLLVMLHGCTQDPDDFAAGTRMNILAEEHGVVVAYPEQPRSANPRGCWNWFNRQDQRRDSGEPAIIAGLTRQIMAEHEIDERQVFVAGLSAGGAMAAVMGATYPDLYAAVGIHSGVPHGAAADAMSAFAAMRGEARKVRLQRSSVRTIVFHGDADDTVHPVNADRIIDALGLDGEVERLATPGYTRVVVRGHDGAPVAEQWRLHGVGHAWSGGSTEGSYATPDGPDASREMLRFFLAQACCKA